MELNFIISCESKTSASDEMAYSVKCPISSCAVDKLYSVIWKSYPRSTKNKNNDEAPKFCQPRWFFCSLKNHFQKWHLDNPDNEIPTIDNGSNNGSSNDFDMSGSTMNGILRDGSTSSEQLMRALSKDKEIPLTMDTESTSNNNDDVRYMKENETAILSTNDDAALSAKDDHTHSMDTVELSLSENIDDLMVGVGSKISRAQKTKNATTKPKRVGACDNGLPKATKRLRK